MALKSKEWFYKQCLYEVKNWSPLAHLAWDILEKGIGQRDQTRGHVTQAIGAAQKFLEDHPRFVHDIRDTDRTKPLNIRAYPRIANGWTAWLGRRQGAYGRHAFGYNYRTLRGYLPPNLGGSRRRGGGGADELKRVLRLMAEFAGRR